MNEDLTSIVSVAIVGAVLIGFAAGSRFRKSKPRFNGGLLRRQDSSLAELKTRQSPVNDMEDKRCFFIFTSLVLDLLPVFLRLYFRVRWFETRGRKWKDRPSDGEAFWYGTYDLEPFTTVRVTEGSTVSSVVIPNNNTNPTNHPLRPGERIKIGREPTKVVCTRGHKVHLSSPSTSSGDLPLFRQKLPGERNADSRMAPFFEPRVLRGDVRGWDVSLLCFALLYSSHCLMDTAASEAKAMVEAIRDLRNDKLAHVERCAMSPQDLNQALSTMDSFISVCIPEHWESWIEGSRGLMEEARNAYTRGNDGQDYDVDGMRRGGIGDDGMRDGGEIHISIEQSEESFEGYETDDSLDTDLEVGYVDATIQDLSGYYLRGEKDARRTLERVLIYPAGLATTQGGGGGGGRDHGDRLLFDRWAEEFRVMSLSHQMSDIYGRFSCSAVKFTNAWVSL